MLTGDELPSLRGRLHLHTIWFSLAAAALLVAFAPPGTPRVTAAIYGVGLNALFIASAVYHRWPPASRWKPILRRVDHCVIFIFIAASYTPVAALLLEPPSSTIVLVSVWAARSSASYSASRGSTRRGWRSRSPISALAG